MAQRLVVIGGDAAGMTAASQARRLDPTLEIIALDKGPYTSYSACGIPYHVSGDVEPLERLVVRTPQEFRDRQRIDVRVLHEVTGIDLDARRVEVRDHDHGRSLHLTFDHLLVATGARPLRLGTVGVVALSRSSNHPNGRKPATHPRHDHAIGRSSCVGAVFDGVPRIAGGASRQHRGA